MAGAVYHSERDRILFSRERAGMVRRKRGFRFVSAGITQKYPRYGYCGTGTFDAPYILQAVKIVGKTGGTGRGDVWISGL